MLNKVFLQGNLATEPDIRHTQNGTAVSSFRLAVNRDFKSQDGTRETDFINIVAWRGAAEFVGKCFTKGQQAVIEGRLQVRQYTDREGNKRSVTEVVASNIYFCGQRRDNPMTADLSDGEPPDFATLSENDGELPF